MPPSSNKDKDLRTQAVSSVAQDMSSARLRILGDLMDNRKRAEHHEQEFLRTIHSENSAFTQIVSLFENSLAELREESTTTTEQIQSRLDSVAKSIPNIHETMIADLGPQISALKDEVARVNAESHAVRELLPQQLSELREQMRSMPASWENQMEAIKSDVAASVDSVKADFAQPVQVIDGKVAQLIQDTTSLRSRVGHLESLIESKIANCVKTLTDRMECDKAELTNVFATKTLALESRLIEMFDSRIAGIEEPLTTQLESELTKAVLGMESKLTAQSAMAREQVTSMTDEIFLNVNNRLLQLEQQSRGPAEADYVLSQQLETLVSSINIKNEALMNERIQSVSAVSEGRLHDLSVQVEQQAALIHSIAHSGFHHEWRITHPIARLNSLGLLSTGGKYINSEPFSIGPYKNLQLRLFPVSQQSGSNPAVWLIHRPMSADTLIPIFVDISIGQSKKGPIKMKKVQELFGHWVWEASFPIGVVQSEIDNDCLTLSVEISLRQWMDVPQEPVVETTEAFEEVELPDSPSAMSNYTFAPTLPALPLRPIQTNPFDKGEGKHKADSLTPRRSSWAQFGEEVSSTVSNPFR